MNHPPNLPRESQSIVELLSQRARFCASQKLYRFLRFDSLENSVVDDSRLGKASDHPLSPANGSCDQQNGIWEEFLTYEQADRKARIVGGWLQNYHSSAGGSMMGQRVLLVFPPGLDYLSAYFGCLYAGAIAVPAYPPRRNRRAERLQSIVRDAGLSLVLAPRDLIQSLRDTIEADEILRSLDWQAVEDIPPAAADSWHDPQVDKSTIAFLQYTSGSTGDPKGVIVTHGNLLHNQSLIRTHFATRRDPRSSLPIELTWELPIEQSETVVGWLPLHHDMGLIGNVLHPLYVGGQLIFMAPIDFLQKPIRWLETITRFRATISGGPNFAYRLCADEITEPQSQDLDLSSWQVAFNGAEPIDPSVLRRFSEKFRGAGFQSSSFVPCYGMAETTLLVTSSTCGLQPVMDDSSQIVGCGKLDPKEMDVRIVDPETCVERADGIEGEIWVRGESVAAGYWERKEQTEQTFGAILSQATVTSDAFSFTSHEKQKYLRTGDLGYQKAGQLFVTGRLKDLIIVRGVNHYPQDIERTAENSHQSLLVGGAAAFAIDVDGEEQVAVIQEVRRTDIRSFDTDQIAQAVLRSVLESHEVTLAAIAFVRPGGLPKTTSGKVQRGEAKRLFLADELKPVGLWTRKSPISSTRSNAVLAEASVGDSVRSSAGESLSPNLTKIVTVSDQQRNLRTWLTSRIAARLKLSERTLDIHQPLAAYGLDSLAAVRLAGETSDYLGRPIAPTLAYEYPTIALLAAHLAGEEPETPGHLKNQHSVGTNGALRCEEPLAVVGIGCCLPGADSAESFWELLRDGRCAISDGCGQHQGREFAFGEKTPGKAGFLTDIDKFDAEFFGINSREADSLDPQQRLLLEVTWQAFEDAAIPLDKIAGKSVGVFIGAGNNDYSRLSAGRSSTGNGYGATGNSMAMAANRISYTFDFRGPSYTIDTACSSSLVATHQAIRAMRAGECELAVVGGVNLILSDEATAAFNRAGMLAADGVCRAFADGASGFVRGEGCGVIVLKRLSEAQQDSNRIYAVLKGSAINQDGRTNGLTAPSRQAQQSLIVEALQDADVNAEAIDYIEAHGTGTELGDPIEIRAIRAALSLDANKRPVERPLLVGSVKTNIGHLEAAAGIAGLIKVCLSLWHRQVAPNLNFDKPSPHIDFGSIEIPKRLRQWPCENAIQAPAMAGVSSFGFGGANAHVIVQSYELERQQERRSDDLLENFTESLIVCSARSEHALERQIYQVTQDLKRRADEEPESIASAAYTLAAGRSHHRYRAAITLRDFTQGSESSNVEERTWLKGSVASDFETGWLFSGQGGTFVSAGQGLYGHHATFRKYFDVATDQCQQLVGVDPRQILWGKPEDWLSIEIQPALFSLQWALAQTYLAMDLRPSFVLGHSLGEYAAACIAGVFSLEDGLRIVGKRAALTGALKQRGGMLAVFADEATVLESLQDAGFDLDVAAVNGPRQTVVAGEAEELQRLESALRLRRITTRMMQTSHGFHSRLVEPVLSEFESFLGTIELSKPCLTFMQSQTGRLAEGVDEERVATPAYWCGNLRNSVRFFPSLESIKELVQSRVADRDVSNANFFCMEIGPGSTLHSIVRAAKLGLRSLPGLNAGQHETEQFLENLTQVYVAGASLNWTATLGYQTKFVSVPGYPFERQRYWYGEHGGLSQETSKSFTGTIKPSAVPASAIPVSTEPLGERLPLSTNDLVYQFELDANNYLRDHVVAGAIVYPAAAILGLAEHARRTLDPALGLRYIADLQIQQAVVLDSQHSIQCQVVISRGALLWEGRLCCKIDSAWKTHATWTYQKTAKPVACDATKLAEPTGRFEKVDLDSFYDRFSVLGLQYGPSFRVLCSLEMIANRARGECQLQTAEVTAEDERFHATLLDGCLQAIGAAAVGWGKRSWLPVGIEKSWFSPFVALGKHCTFDVEVADDHVGRMADAGDVKIANVRIYDQQRELVIELLGVQLKATAAPDIEGLLFEECFIPQIRQRELQTAFSGHLTLELPVTHDLAGHLALSEAPSLASLLDRLEHVAGESVVYILQELGFEFRAGKVIRKDELAGELKIVPEHHRLFGRMLGILEETDVLESSESVYHVKRDLQSRSLDDLFAEAQEQHPEAINELTLLKRCVKKASACLSEKLDPLPLLFPADGSISAAEVYRDSAGGRIMNRLVEATVEELVRSLPAGRGIRVLEIGAGTGATTEAVLKALPVDRCTYCFSDVAASFLAAARERFGHLKYVDFGIIDIEQEPEANLFNKFDLIIAANVLHATTDLAQSVEHARVLLSDGGVLLVMEGTTPIRWMDLTFGLTSGWWRFTDTKLRQDYPLLARPQWLELFTQQGFSATATISPKLTESGDRQAENSLLLARKAPGSTLYSVTEDAKRRIRVIGDSRSELVEELTSKFGHAKHVELVKDQASFTDLVFVLSALDQSHCLNVAESVEQFSIELLQEVQETIRGLQDSQINHATDEVRVWLVTSGAQVTGRADASDSAVDLAHSTALGFWRTLALEQPTWKCINVDLEPTESTDVKATLIFEEMLSDTDLQESEVVFSDQVRLVRRLKAVNSALVLSGTENRMLQLHSRGSLDSIHLRDATRPAPDANEVEIQVQAAGLNFRDVLISLGLYPGNQPLGAEAVGIVTRIGSNVRHVRPGQRVAALATGTFADYVLANAVTTVAIPECITWEEAATVPVAYLTAAIALLDVANLQAGQTILVHSAAGGVGTAACNIARACGANVIATASPSKHQLLRERGVRHVFDSRNAGFADLVLGVTDGRGVDVILNSLDSGRAAENLQSLAAGGYCVDITLPDKAVEDLIRDSGKNVQYSWLDLSALIREYPADVAATLTQIYDRVADGVYPGLAARIYGLNDYADAFRALRDGTSTGKLLLCPTTNQQHDARLETSSDDGWHLITGGLGGLGLSLVKDLLAVGYRRVALIARRQPTEKESELLAGYLREGIEIKLLQADVSSFEELAEAIRQLRQSHSVISSVFHLAGSLDDATILNQSGRSFHNVYAAKVHGAWNLHLLTSGDALKRFVMYSSASAVFGSPGQANHASANAFMDSLARYRRSKRLPATSINWGPWSDVGAAAELDVQNRIDISGMGMLDAEAGSAICRRLLRTQGENLPAVWAVMNLRLEQNLGRLSNNRLFELLFHENSHQPVSNAGSLELAHLIRQAEDSQRGNVMSSILRQLVARTLGTSDIDRIKNDRPFFEMGMDSLTSLELANSLKGGLGVPISTNELFNYPTITKLSQRLLELFDAGASHLQLVPSTVTYVEQATDVAANGNDADAENDEVETLLLEIGALTEEFDQWEASR